MWNQFLCFIKLICRAGGVAQVVDCLTSKHEALSSNPSADKNKAKQNSCLPHLDFFQILLIFQMPNVILQ
jgi:hypothetical protein